MVEHKNDLSLRYPHDVIEFAMPGYGPIHAGQLADLTLAANGLKAVLRIVVASGVQEGIEPGYPLDVNHASGLLDAAQALAAMLDDGLVNLGERLSRTASEESERSGTRHVWRMNLVPVREEVRHD